jgi:tryptophan-rich sensory protein
MLSSTEGANPVGVPDWSVVLFLLFFIGVPFIINAAIGNSSVSGSGIGGMENVRKAFPEDPNTDGILPPGWVFALVWTILYAAMGVSLWFALRDPPKAADSQRYGIWIAGILLFAIGTTLNWAWTPVFTSDGDGAARDALWILLGALVTTGTGAALFVENSVPAAAMLVPLLVWYVYAMLLNVRVVERTM